jgi:hypothetical protein
VGQPRTLSPWWAGLVDLAVEALSLTQAVRQCRVDFSQTGVSSNQASAIQPRSMGWYLTSEPPFLFRT